MYSVVEYHHSFTSPPTPTRSQQHDHHHQQNNKIVLKMLFLCFINKSKSRDNKNHNKMEYYSMRSRRVSGRVDEGGMIIRAGSGTETGQHKYENCIITDL